MTCASSTKLRERISGLPPEARTLMTDTLDAMQRQRPERRPTAEQWMEVMRTPTGMEAAARDAMRAFKVEEGARKGQAKPVRPRGQRELVNRTLVRNARTDHAGQVGEEIGEARRTPTRGQASLDLPIPMRTLRDTEVTAMPVPAPEEQICDDRVDPECACYQDLLSELEYLCGLVDGAFGGSIAFDGTSCLVETDCPYNCDNPYADGCSNMGVSNSLFVCPVEEWSTCVDDDSEEEEEEPDAEEEASTWWERIADWAGTVIGGPFFDGRYKVREEMRDCLEYCPVFFVNTDGEPCELTGCDLHYFYEQMTEVECHYYCSKPLFE